MDLQSAFDRKRQLEELFGGRVRSGRRLFAFGVAVPQQGTQYAVAVRAPSEGDLPSDELAEIQEIAGEVDVRYTGVISALGDEAVAQATTGIAKIGSSVAHYRCSAGTLGFFARRNSDHSVGIVSSNHVLALSDQGCGGDEILHPAPRDHGRRPHDVIARLDEAYPRLRRSDITVDCAFARLVDGLEYDPFTLGDGKKLDPTPGEPAAEPEVSKVGRTTGLTHGRISAIAIEALDIDYPFGVMRLVGQMEIEAAVPDVPFSRRGDSGSLVYTRSSGRPIGLVFACSTADRAGGLGLTYANPIDEVLSALNVSFMS